MPTTRPSSPAAPPSARASSARQNDIISAGVIQKRWICASRSQNVAASSVAVVSALFGAADGLWSAFLAERVATIFAARRMLDAAPERSLLSSPAGGFSPGAGALGSSSR